MEFYVSDDRIKIHKAKMLETQLFWEILMPLFHYLYEQ